MSVDLNDVKARMGSIPNINDVKARMGSIPNIWDDLIFKGDRPIILKLLTEDIPALLAEVERLRVIADAAQRFVQTFRILPEVWEALSQRPGGLLSLLEALEKK